MKFIQSCYILRVPYFYQQQSVNISIVYFMLRPLFLGRNGLKSLACGINSLVTKKLTTKFSSATLKKKVKSMLYHIENSKTGGQIV